MSFDKHHSGRISKPWLNCEVRFSVKTLKTKDVQQTDEVMKSHRIMGVVFNDKQPLLSMKTNLM